MKKVKLVLEVEVDEKDLDAWAMMESFEVGQEVLIPYIERELRWLNSSFISVNLLSSEVENGSE